MNYFGPRSVRFWIDKEVRKRIQKTIFLQGNVDSTLSFCLVHWNAPDYLILSVKQIIFLYPNCKIYILDNDSELQNFSKIYDEFKSCKNVTLFRINIPPFARYWPFNTIRWQSHTAGLQFLLNFAANQSDKISVFLDQDCMLVRPIDNLFGLFNDNVNLIGARDVIIVPKDYEYLKKGTLRNSIKYIHPSFMMLQPKRIIQLFGKSAFYGKLTESSMAYPENAEPEPYHGISMKSLGKILFLEPRMSNDIPFLTSYVYNEEVYAWHAWYSSRTTGSNSTTLDGYPVSWLRNVSKVEYDFMAQLLGNRY